MVYSTPNNLILYNDAEGKVNVNVRFRRWAMQHIIQTQIEQ